MNLKKEIMEYVRSLDENGDSVFLKKLYTLIRRYIIRRGGG